MKRSAGQDIDPIGRFNEADRKKILANDMLALTALSYPKRVKRILANYESAERFKLKRVKYVAELQHKIQTMEKKLAELSAKATTDPVGECAIAHKMQRNTSRNVGLGWKNTMNSEEIVRLCASFSLKDVEGLIRKPSADLKLVVIQRLTLSLVGKVLSSKLVNREAFMKVLKNIWRVKNGVEIEVVTGNVFVFHFKTQEVVDEFGQITTENISEKNVIAHRKCDASTGPESGEVVEKKMQPTVGGEVVFNGEDGDCSTLNSTTLWVAEIDGGASSLASVFRGTGVVDELEASRHMDGGSLGEKHECCEDGISPVDFVFGSQDGNIIPVKTVERSCLLDISADQSLSALRDQ
ncbi:hypothetical protein Ddye_017709 [Dipteronia dyeriana]|uniref:BZIP domain-containing protein n=1 Tax=Dipteronia dyeriana TaxID=168575 RepID=A0AAD9X1M9_9ROSI|nr:hypothetical protein Ddye_017709 [Dipteronia dyeriana]